MTVAPIRLYNTMTRQIEELKPLKQGRVSIYCCGPTVYHFPHIGNMRMYLFEDVLVRTLRAAGYTVDHVMNITDVGHLVGDGDSGEDKMAVAMKREKKRSAEIADFYTNVFFTHSQKLNIERPTTVCKATEHVQEMIALIQRLEARGVTYVHGGNVYFDVSKFRGYGKLAKLDLEKLLAGARIEVDPNKRNPHDFVLWFTRSKFENQELQWDSPWGSGYPGWHIECSAMSVKYLGEEFDIHCGGIDHIPVHHTNEIAQTEAATGKPWVRIWMHGEFLVMNKEKMAKSSGSFLTVDSIIERGIDPCAYRFFCLGAHYRAQLSWSWEALEGAAQGYERLKRAVLALKASPPSAPAHSGEHATISAHHDSFHDALFNDLNVPKSLAVVWNVLGDARLAPASKLALLTTFDRVLGLGVNSWQEEAVTVPPPVQELLNRRQQARTQRDWAASDSLRKEIEALGFSVEDKKGEQLVKKR